MPVFSEEIKLTSKERAALRAQANSLDALFQIGKGGISDSVIKQTEEALKARELIKVKILLESAPESPRETADRLAAATGSDVVQLIGGTIVLYKENPELGQEKKPAKKPAQSKPLSKVKAKKAALDRKKRIEQAAEKNRREYNRRGKTK